MESLGLLLDKCGFIKKDRVSNDFKAIEDFIGFSLPADYKFYLDNYEPFDDIIGEQWLVLDDINLLLESKGIYSPEQRKANTIQIGGNGASEAIGIRHLGDNSYQIVIAQYIMDVDDHIEIGSSFTDMLQRLISGVEWFR